MATRPDRSQQLLVTANLRLDADGVQAQVSGNGDRLRVTTDHPTRLLLKAAPLMRLGGPGRARSGLDQLAAQGLTITVAGPRRDLVHVGAAAGPGHVRLAFPRRAVAMALAVAVLAVLTRTRRH